MFNKTDLLDEAVLLALQERVASDGQEAVFVSTVSEHGMDPLKRALLARMRVRRPLAEWLRMEGTHAAGKRVVDVGCGSKPYQPFFANAAAASTSMRWSSDRSKFMSRAPAGVWR